MSELKTTAQKASETKKPATGGIKKRLTADRIDQSEFVPATAESVSLVRKMDYVEIDPGECKESKPGTEKRLILKCRYTTDLLIAFHSCRGHSRITGMRDREYGCYQDDRKMCQPFLCTESCKRCGKVVCIGKEKEEKEEKEEKKCCYIQDQYAYTPAGDSVRVILKFRKQNYKCSDKDHTERYQWPWEKDRVEEASEDGKNKPYQYGSLVRFEIVPFFSMTRRAVEQCIKETIEYDIPHAVRRYYIGPEYLKKKIRKNTSLSTNGMLEEMIRNLDEQKIESPLVLYIYAAVIGVKTEYLFFLDEVGHVLDFFRNDTHRYDLEEKISSRFANRDNVQLVIMEPDPALTRTIKDVFGNSRICFDESRIQDHVKRMKLDFRKQPETGLSSEKKLQKKINTYLKKCGKYKMPDEFRMDYLEKCSGLATALDSMVAYMNSADKGLSVDLFRLKYCGWQNIPERSEYCQRDREHARTLFAIEKLYQKNRQFAEVCMDYSCHINDPKDVLRMATARTDGKRVNVFRFWQYFPKVDFDALTEENIHLAKWGRWFDAKDDSDYPDMLRGESVPYRKISVDEWTSIKCQEQISMLEHYRESPEYRESMDLEKPTVVFGRYANAPIEWLCFRFSYGPALLVSKYGLDAKPFDESNPNAVWEDCSLRKWLNGEFYDMAFNDGEKRCIVSPVKGEFPFFNNNVTEFQAERIVTGDRVILMDNAEYICQSDDKICYPTEYAISKGAVTDPGGASEWWMREVSEENLGAHGPFCTNGDGVLCAVDATAVACVRPAIWINLEMYQS